jgi:hypothetical protein
MTLRTCKKCDQTKPIEKFHFYGKGHQSRRQECAECTQERRKRTEEENTERPFKHAPLEMAVLFKSGQNCWCCRRTTLPGKMLCRICSTERPLDNRKREARDTTAI